MKFIALVSGGKDSVYNIIECVSFGHELICIGNLYQKGEIDSFMYQTVGGELVDHIAKCLDVPLVKREIKVTLLIQGLPIV